MKRRKLHLRKDNKFTYCGLLHNKSVFEGLINCSCHDAIKPTIGFIYEINKYNCIKCQRNYRKELQS